MTADSFDLQPATGPPEGYLMPRAAADALGVSTVTLGKWRKDHNWGESLARNIVTIHGPTWYYHEPRVRAWMAINRREGVGGTREGAGRPRTRRAGKNPAADQDAASGPVRRELEPTSPLEHAAVQAKAETDAAERKRLADLAASITDPSQIAGLVLDGHVTAAQAQTLKNMMGQARGATALKVERGELVDKAQTRREIIEQLSRSKIRLMGRESPWTDRLILALGLPADARAKAAAAVRAMLLEVCEDLRAAEA